MGDLPTPLPTRQELLTQQFYDWEWRGRGWVVWNRAVALEPPFRRFDEHYVSPSSMEDDGIQESLWRRIAVGLLGGGRDAKPPMIEEPEAEPEPEGLSDRSELVEMQVALPKDFVASREIFEQCLFSLNYCRAALTFEVVGTQEGIVAQIVAAAGDSQPVLAQHTTKR